MNDPAVLFYPGDFICETMGMSRIERDCYMDLYILQFNQYHFTEEMARNVLKEDFEIVWKNIKSRFIKEDDFFYNGNLRAAIAKRRAYTASRKEIASKRKPKDGAEDKEEKQQMLSMEELPGEAVKTEIETRNPAQKQIKLRPDHVLNGVSAYWESFTEDNKKNYQKAIWDNFFLVTAWQEEACKLQKWNLKDFDKKLKDFLKDNVITGEIARGEKALKKHFINKYKKTIT